VITPTTDFFGRVRARQVIDAYAIAVQSTIINVVNVDWLFVESEVKPHRTESKTMKKENFTERTIGTHVLECFFLV